ncbi:MAG: hypothetical protein LBQ54_08900 [Planctomycetaceae bacterium]|nr:hypothetical protein [Planctomycetaceae bacterium]
MYNLLRAATGRDALILTERPLGDDVQAGHAVYFNTATSRFERAWASLSFLGFLVQSGPPGYTQ